MRAEGGGWLTYIILSHSIAGCGGHISGRSAHALGYNGLMCPCYDVNRSGAVRRGTEEPTASIIISHT